MAEGQTESPEVVKSEVLKWMKDLNDWYSVGERLGVRHMKLSRLETDYPTDPDRAKDEMVDMWFEKDSDRSWSKLADAFDYASQRALAKRIRETYNCPKKQPRPRQVIQHPVKKEKPKPPPKEVLTNGLPTYPHPPASPPPSPPPYRMPRIDFQCHCGRCNPVMVLSRSAREDANKLRLRPSLKAYRSSVYFEPVIVEIQLKKETDEMMTRVGSFVARFLHSLKSRSISTATLLECLLNTSATKPPHEPVPFLQHRARELRSMHTVDDLVFLISDYVSFFNYHLFDYLIRKLGSEEDKEELESFVDYRDVFCKRSFYKIPYYIYGYIRLPTETLLVFRTDNRWVVENGSSIFDVSLLVNHICHALRLLPHAIFLCRIDLQPAKKWMELVCRMPPHLLEEVFPLTSDQEKLLADMGVFQVHSLSFCRYPSTCEDERWYNRAHPEIMEKYHNTPRTAAHASKNRRTEEKVLKKLKTCCRYHGHLDELHTQSRELVTGGDKGYDGDHDSSDEETGPIGPIPGMGLRRSYQKRLMWRLANSHF